MLTPGVLAEIIKRDCGCLSECRAGRRPGVAVRGWCGECDGGKAGGVVAGPGAAIFVRKSGFTGRFLRREGEVRQNLGDLPRRVFVDERYMQKGGDGGFIEIRPSI